MALFGIAWLLIAVALAVTLHAPLWRDCAGETLSGSATLSLACLIVALLVLFAPISLFGFGRLRPLAPLVATVSLTLATGGWLAVVGVIWWHHHYTCAGG